MKKSIMLSLIIFVLYTLISCKKDGNQNNESDEPSPVLGEVKGKIILPSTSTLDANAFRVHSYVGSSNVVDKEFIVKEYVSEFNSLFVLNPAGSVMLIGYDYPEQLDKNITISTTAVALVMNTPAALSLSKEGKLDLISRIKSDTNFHKLEIQIEGNLNANRDLFANGSTTVFHTLENLITSASRRPTQPNSPNDAVLYSQMSPDNVFKFYNDGKRLISTVVGIYKDNVRIDEHTLAIEGINMFPGSIHDITNLDFAAVSSPPLPKYYTLTDLGRYELKARTGRPDAFELSKDYKEAFILNIQKLSYNLVKPIMPKLTKSLLPCLARAAQAVYDLHGIRNYDIVSLTYEAINQTFSDAPAIETCITGNTDLYNSSYLPIFSRYFARLNLIFLPGSVANQTLFGIQWMFIHSSLDMCFETTSNSTTECEGNDWIIIGTQKWKRKNLDVSTYRNGDPIPQVSNPTQWTNLQTGAWCYYNNDPAYATVYGKLYNWYAVNDPRGLAPIGYHIPSYPEFQTLVDFLGPPQVASGKLKEAGTSHWLSPNLNTDNSSGFTALPGGFRQGQPSQPAEFYGIGTVGRWWSKTPRSNSNSDATFLLLQQTNSNTVFYDYYKSNGHSVRCIKD